MRKNDFKKKNSWNSNLIPNSLPMLSSYDIKYDEMTAVMYY